MIYSRSVLCLRHSATKLTSDCCWLLRWHTTRNLVFVNTLSGYGEVLIVTEGRPAMSQINNK